MANHSNLQDTGNPVLDSLVNVIQADPSAVTVEMMDQIHEKLLELAMKEPGGFGRRGKDDQLIIVKK